MTAQHRLPARRALVAVGALGAAAALSACTAPRPGAAATVGNGRIEISDLADRVDALSALPALKGASRVNLQRAVLAELITDRVDDRVASQAGVSVSASEVTAAIDSYKASTGAKTDNQVLASLLSSTSPSGATQTPAGYAGLQSYARDNLLVSKLRTAYAAKLPITEAALHQLYNANPTAFNSADISVIVLSDAAKATADYAKLVKNPANFGNIARIDSLSTETAQNGGEYGTVPEGELGTQVDSLLFAGKAGDVLQPINDEGSYVIIKINSLTVKDYQSAHADLVSEAKNPAGAPTVRAIATQRQAAANQLGVWVNPRFGTWAGAGSLPSAGASAASIVPPNNPLATAPGTTSVPSQAPSLFLPGSSGGSGAGSASGTGSGSQTGDTGGAGSVDPATVGNAAGTTGDTNDTSGGGSTGGGDSSSGTSDTGGGTGGTP